jgi:hypothetical protein
MPVLLRLWRRSSNANGSDASHAIYTMKWCAPLTAVHTIFVGFAEFRLLLFFALHRDLGIGFAGRVIG